MVNTKKFIKAKESHKEVIEKHNLEKTRDEFFRKVFKVVLIRLNVKNDDRLLVPFFVRLVRDQDIDLLFYKFIDYLADDYSESQSIELALLWAADKWELSCSISALGDVANYVIDSLHSSPYKLTKDVIAKIHKDSSGFRESEEVLMLG